MFPGSARNFEICPKPTPISRTKKLDDICTKLKLLLYFLYVWKQREIRNLENLFFLPKSC